jgi:hypothetical protein
MGNSTPFCVNEFNYLTVYTVPTSYISLTVKGRLVTSALFPQWDDPGPVPPRPDPVDDSPQLPEEQAHRGCALLPVSPPAPADGCLLCDFICFSSSFK